MYILVKNNSLIRSDAAIRDVDWFSTLAALSSWHPANPEIAGFVKTRVSLD